MESAQLKIEMMSLWKKTFNDSDEYISLVFDGYFNPEYIEYEERDGHLVAALLGIPYRFVMSREAALSGLYLCGLATKPEFRRQGIMTKLVDKINKKASINNFDFTFLIPASSELSDYYFGIGYVDCFKRISNRYSSLHNFFLDDELFRNENICPLICYNDSGLNLKVFIEEVKEIDNELLTDVDNFLDEICNNDSYFDILRNVKDVDLILRENLISKGRVVVVRNCDNNKITAIAIFNINKNDEILIPHLYGDDNFSKRLLLQYIKQQYPNFSILRYKYPEEEKRKLVWSPFNFNYKTSENNRSVEWNEEDIYEVGSHPENYGMALLLRASEILKFTCNDKNDFKFSILVKQPFSDFEYIYIKSERGVQTMLVVGETPDQYKVQKVKQELPINEHSCLPSDESEVFEIAKKGIMRLSMPQLAEILWRNRQVNDLIGEAFFLPRVPINMSYLLD